MGCLCIWMGKLLKCHLKGKTCMDIGQYIDYSEEKKMAQGLFCPYTWTIFYNICIYSRSQVSVYRTIGPLVFNWRLWVRQPEKTRVMTNKS